MRRKIGGHWTIGTEQRETEMAEKKWKKKRASTSTRHDNVTTTDEKPTRRQAKAWREKRTKGEKKTCNVILYLYCIMKILLCVCQWRANVRPMSLNSEDYDDSDDDDSTRHSTGLVYAKRVLDLSHARRRRHCRLYARPPPLPSMTARRIFSFFFLLLLLPLHLCARDGGGDDDIVCAPRCNCILYIQCTICSRPL